MFWNRFKTYWPPEFLEQYSLFSLAPTHTFQTTTAQLTIDRQVADVIYDPPLPTSVCDTHLLYIIISSVLFVEHLRLFNRDELGIDPVRYINLSCLG